eukprot:CAMPEP_0181350422 /NCGR_PEP_ID=MMETSP1106-20121128/1256_1 /TAXON_ID=81844 /ORGANISM="Mantoniella antarctica, Strain SL-175" /LENGTH=142 /DNA_ID=CAMNT_0023462891 /DNA_START=66 /DNA_END=491 /DNA_ORIENTATION=+
MVGRGPLLRSQERSAQRRTCSTKKLLARLLLCGGAAAYVAYIGVRQAPGSGHAAALGPGSGRFYEASTTHGDDEVNSMGGHDGLMGDDAGERSSGIEGVGLEVDTDTGRDDEGGVEGGEGRDEGGAETSDDSGRGSSEEGLT